MALLFLYNLKVKTLLIFFKRINKVSYFIFLINNISAIKKYIILSINFTIFGVYQGLNSN